MLSSKNKKHEHNVRSSAGHLSDKSNSIEYSHQPELNHPEAANFKNLQRIADESVRVDQVNQLQSTANNPITNNQKTSKPANHTGLPDVIKAGIENLSGISMDDVRVHYNSGKPAQLQAHAYAQGTDIYLGPSQEKHLPHEAWHVVQQKQGRVSPTLQLKGQININDDVGLEKEADEMGEKATNKATSSASMNLRSMKPKTVIQRSKLTPIKSSPPLPSPFTILSAELPNVPLHLNVNDPHKTNDPSAAQSNYIRPTEVEAEIVGARRQQGMRPPSSVPSSVGNLGDQERLIRRGERVKTYQGGHLVGDELLDGSINSMVDWNLAPQHEGFNHPVYFQIEEAIAKGPHGPDGKINRNVPIKVGVLVTYEGEQYSVTVQDLIDRGIVSAAAVDQNKINRGKSISLPYRVPVSWQAKAEVIGGTFPPMMLPPSVPAAMAPGTGFPTDISPSEFLISSPQLGKSHTGQWMFTGGQELLLRGMQGRIDPANMAQFDPSQAPPPASAPLPTFPPIFGSPSNINALITKHTGDLSSFEPNIRAADPGITQTAFGEFIRAINKRYYNVEQGAKYFTSHQEFIIYLKRYVNLTPGGRALIRRFELDTSLGF